MGLLETSELGLGRVPDSDRVDVGADHVLEVCRHGTTVDLGAGARAPDALGDVEDDAGEAVLIDPDLLVVGDLAQLARTVGISSLSAGRAKNGRPVSQYLTSANFLGRSQTTAPP